MAIYRFVAKDAEGKKITGEVEGIDEKNVVGTLRAQNLVPIEIKSNISNTSKKVVAIPSFGGVPPGEVVSFTRQFSTMLSAGLPLTDALAILEKQTKNARFSKILSEVVSDIEGGMSLSGALAKHPKVFSQVYIKLIEAGETGGVLDKVLIKLADTLEKEKEFKSKTKGAFSDTLAQVQRRRGYFYQLSAN